MALSKKMHQMLLDQVKYEWEAQFYYMQMWAWCENNDWEGFAQFFRHHADEERVHGQKILDYLAEVGADVVIPSVETHEADFKGVTDLFERALAHEEKVTALIHELMCLAKEKNDFRTATFLQWYVTEQIEEEALCQMALSKVKRSEDHPAALLMVEEQLAKIEADGAGGE